MPVLGLAETTQDLVQGGVLIDAGQCVEVAFGCPPADLGAVVSALEVTGPVVFLVTVVLQWRWGRRRARLRQAADLCAGELAISFPSVVQGWGGTGRLRDRAFLEQQLFILVRHPVLPVFGTMTHGTVLCFPPSRIAPAHRDSKFSMTKAST